MAESKSATWLTAIATLVGVVTLIWAFVEHSLKERAADVQHWQRVVVYKVIAERRGIQFNELKVRYVAEAAQVQTVSLPTKDIQDDALRYVLLDLQRDKLIQLGVDNSYHALVDSPPMVDEITITMRNRMKRDNDVILARPAILRFVERESGALSTEEIIQLCREKKIEIVDEDAYNLIADLRAQHIIEKDETGKLWATHEVETKGSARKRR
jgi:hypothetical protein